VSPLDRISSVQRADLEAALRAYEHELEPDWIEPPDYFLRKLDPMFGDPDRWMWWATPESGPRVGLAIFRKFRDWPDESGWVGSIAEFTIFPAHRRRGYGTSFARTVVRELRAAGCGKVELSVLWQRDESFRFWQAVGFEPVFIQMECRQQIL